MKLKNKYYFRPYNPVFPKLFENEKVRLQKAFGESVRIDHIGSTAVSGLGGKGVIDISVVVPKEDFYLSMDVDRFNFVPLVQGKKVIKYTNH